MKLEGLLVDLVQIDQRFRTLEHKWRNSDAQFWAGGGERNFESARFVEQLLARRAERSAENPASGIWFGIQTKDGTPIGGIGPSWINPAHRWAMLGAKIGEPEYWGGGYGTDALLLVIDHCFGWLDLRRLWLFTTSMNLRVQRQMEKVGFSFEARQRNAAYADGEWFDWLAYGLMRDEWPGRAAKIERLGLRARVEQDHGEGT